MKRYTLFLIAIAGSAATALAAIAPQPTGFDREPETRNVTIIEKNQAFPLIGPFVVEECLVDDCSVTRG